MPAVEQQENKADLNNGEIPDNVVSLPEKTAEDDVEQVPSIPVKVDNQSAEPQTAAHNTAMKPMSAAAVLAATKAAVQNTQLTENYRSIVLASVILLMTTLPALYIAWTSVQFIGGGGELFSPGSMTKFVFAYATIKSELFNLFTVAALPTLTAYFGAAGGKYRDGFLPWLLFTYFLILFVSTFVPQVVAASTFPSSPDWAAKLKAIAADPQSITDYLTTVRNGAMAGIAVLTGIKLAT